MHQQRSPPLTTTIGARRPSERDLIVENYPSKNELTQPPGLCGPLHSRTNRPRPSPRLQKLSSSEVSVCKRLATNEFGETGTRSCRRLRAESHVGGPSVHRVPLDTQPPRRPPLVWSPHPVRELERANSDRRGAVAAVGRRRLAARPGARRDERPLLKRDLALRLHRGHRD